MQLRIERICVTNYIYAAYIARDLRDYVPAKMQLFVKSWKLESTNLDEVMVSHFGILYFIYGGHRGISAITSTYSIST